MSSTIYRLPQPFPLIPPCPAPPSFPHTLRTLSKPSKPLAFPSTHPHFLHNSPSPLHSRPLAFLTNPAGLLSVLKDSEQPPANPEMIPPMGWAAARQGVMRRFAQLILATHHPGKRSDRCIFF